jgi:hypothetical protein
VPLMAAKNTLNADKNALYHDNIRRCAAPGTRSGPRVALPNQSRLSRIRLDGTAPLPVNVSLGATLRPPCNAFDRRGPQAQCGVSCPGSLAISRVTDGVGIADARLPAIQGFAHDIRQDRRPPAGCGAEPSPDAGGNKRTNRTGSGGAAPGPASSGTMERAFAGQPLTAAARKDAMVASTSKPARGANSANR